MPPLCFVSYQLSSIWVLSIVEPVQHAVLNSLKRIVVIGLSAAWLLEPLSLGYATGARVSMPVLNPATPLSLDFDDGVCSTSLCDDGALALLQGAALDTDAGLDAQHPRGKGELTGKVISAETEANRNRQVQGTIRPLSSSLYRW